LAVNLGINVVNCCGVEEGKRGWVVNGGMQVEAWEWMINSRINVVKLMWCLKNVNKFWRDAKAKLV